MAATHSFQAEVSQVLSLVINSLYSNKEIFLRELISNASDALDKLRVNALTDASLLAGDTDLQVRVLFDEEASTVTLWDNGVGMTEEELVQNLGTVAHSGSKAFSAALKDGKKDDVQLIGQFGVGFYSAYLVADTVEVISKAAGSDAAFKWTSQAKETFTVEPAERETRGTSIVLHLRDEQKEFANGYRLRSLISKYSDYVGHAICMEKEDDDGNKEWEQVNQGTALWQRSADDVTEEQYNEFYTHLTHDYQPPLGHTHFKIEGRQVFTGLVFIPKRPPFDLFDPDAKHGARLYVRRVFIMDNCEDLVPKWLRFVKGVVDSDDLPLNVSREILQDSSLVRSMRKQVTKKTLDLLLQISNDKPEEYLDFWSKYGTVLKEGLHFGKDYHKQLKKLVRFNSSAQDKPTSLADYVERMPEAQTKIYYALGPSVDLLSSSPHLEVLKKKGWEVLYLVDGIDQWAIEALEEFDGKTLSNAMNSDLDLDLDDEEKKESEANATKFAPLTDRVKTVLEAHVSEVRVSDRLADSPACLVIPEGGVASHIERLMRAHQQDMPQQKRIFEINPDHPLITNLNALNEAGKTDEVADWVGLLYDQSLLAEGSPIDNPAKFAKRMTALMSDAVALQASS